MSAAATRRVDLPVSGMTCAACARSIERTLARASGVERANVNFATSTATVEFDSGRARVSDLVDAIQDLGYGVPAETGLDAGAEADEPGQGRRLLVAIICGAPLLLLGMLHAAVWMQLLLSLPVVIYAGAPFYIGAWKGLRHRSANMNTLIALGTGAWLFYIFGLCVTLRGGHEGLLRSGRRHYRPDPGGPHTSSKATPRRRASDAILQLMDLQPPVAMVVPRG